MRYDLPSAVLQHASEPENLLIAPQSHRIIFPLMHWKVIHFAHLLSALSDELLVDGIEMLNNLKMWAMKL